MKEREFQRLKQKVENAKAEADRSRGALDHLMGRLKQEYDCDNLEEAKVLLKKFRKKRITAEQELEDEMEVYNEKWGEDD